MWFTRIQKFYNDGLWSKEMVADGVRVGKITAEQYKEIIGEGYVA